jgi:hypothetical protein
MTQTDLKGFVDELAALKAKRPALVEKAKIENCASAEEQFAARKEIERLDAEIREAELFVNSERRNSISLLVDGYNAELHDEETKQKEKIAGIFRKLFEVCEEIVAISGPCVGQRSDPYDFLNGLNVGARKIAVDAFNAMGPGEFDQSLQKLIAVEFVGFNSVNRIDELKRLIAGAEKLSIEELIRLSTEELIRTGE